MTPVAIRESPQSRYPRLAPPLPPITNALRSRRCRLLAPLVPRLSEGSAGEGSPATFSRLLASSNLSPTTCNLPPATCFSSPFVTAADYRTTTQFRDPLSFQSLHLDRGVGSITPVDNSQKWFLRWHSVTLPLCFFFTLLSASIRVHQRFQPLFVFRFSIFALSPVRGCWTRPGPSVTLSRAHRLLRWRFA
jgi:hypothetical protein